VSEGQKKIMRRKKTNFLKNFLTYLFISLLTPCYGFELLQIVPDAELQSQAVLYQQPARLAFSNYRQLNFFYSNWYFDTKISNFGIVLPLGNIATSLDYSLIKLEDTYRTSTDETKDKIEFSNDALSFGFGTMISDVLSFGTAIKFAGQKINWPEDSLTDSITVFDFGFIYTNFKLKQRMGIGLHNYLISGRTDKPYETLSFSGDQKLDKFNFNWGVYLTSFATGQNKLKAGIGIEYPVARYLKLRGGLRYQDIMSFSAGFSVGVKKIHFDYGFLHHFDLGQIHSFSVGIYF